MGLLSFVFCGFGFCLLARGDGAPFLSLNFFFGPRFEIRGPNKKVYLIFQKSSRTDPRAEKKFPVDGPARKSKWEYRGLIGMLGYLHGTTRPDIPMANHQCARFSNNPNFFMNRLSKRLLDICWIPRTRVLFLDLISPEVWNIWWMLILLVVGKMEIISALNLFIQDRLCDYVCWLP